MNPRHARWWAAAGLVLLLLAAAGLRLGSMRFDYKHPDEPISERVAERVLASGSLDTNWKLADLPAVFKQPQYNFSAYLLSGAGVLQVRQWWGPPATAETLAWLRAWSAWLGVATVLLTYLAGKAFFGRATGWCAALFVCFFPLLYQDSLYARPETFAAVLTLAVAGLCAAPRPPFRGAYALAAFLMGVLVATKVSMALLVPLLVLPLLPARPRPDLSAWGPPPSTSMSWLQAWDRGKWLPVALLLGFVAGAPHALANIGDYAEGIQYLRQQYNTGHWPHGRADASLLGRLDYAARYFHGTAGWLLPLALAGAGVAALRRQFRALFVFAVAFATAVQFAAYPTFLERNLSHVIALLMIFAAHAVVALCALATRKPALRAALTGAVALAVLLPALRTTLALRFDELPRKPEKRLAALRASLAARYGTPPIRVDWTPYASEVRQAMGDRCDGPFLVELRHPGDHRTAQMVAELAGHEGFHEVGRLPSNFDHVPASTLHTYFQPTAAFLHRPAGLELCLAKGGGFVGAHAAGDRLPVLVEQPGRGWKLGGTPTPTQDGPGGTHFHGSWDGSDGTTGNLALVVSVENLDYFVLPILTGPVTHRQTFRVSDAATGTVIHDGKPHHRPQWQFALIRLPAGTRAVRIDAADDGDGWGEWHALGMPRALKRN